MGKRSASLLGQVIAFTIPIRGEKLLVVPIGDQTPKFESVGTVLSAVKHPQLDQYEVRAAEIEGSFVVILQCTDCFFHDRCPEGRQRIER